MTKYTKPYAEILAKADKLTKEIKDGNYTYFDSSERDSYIEKYRIKSFSEKLLIWLQSNPDKWTVRDVPFVRLNNKCYFIGSGNSDKKLKSFGFVQQNKGGWASGFVVINDKDWTIKHTVSKKETVMEGDIELYINNFKQI